MTACADSLELIRYGQDESPAIRPTLVAAYAEVYADQLPDPFFSVGRFAQPLGGYASRPGWEAVVAYDGGEAAGYAFASTLPEGSAWRAGMLEPLPKEEAAEDGRRTLALFELMVRRPWRGTGLARRVHEELLAGRRSVSRSWWSRATPRSRRCTRAGGTATSVISSPFPTPRSTPRWCAH